MVKKDMRQHITCSDAQMPQINSRNHPARTSTKTVKNDNKIYWQKKTRKGKRYICMPSQRELLGSFLDVLEKFSKDNLIRLVNTL